jgi:3-hydroxy-9,10-secoandrosta-1,3,5(10)-triene-9,17-dione monooxygenase reductase component
VINIHDEIVRNTIGKALGKIPSGVFILTVEAGDRRGAMMASWVQQAGFNPPTVTVGVGKGRPIGELVRAAGKFGLSVLGEHDMPLMKKYARGVPDGADPFEGVKVSRAPGGIIYLEESAAYLECALSQTMDPGSDHELIVAQIVGGAVLKEGASFVHLRGNGFHY